jgi:hypothetical protein
MMDFIDGIKYVTSDEAHSIIETRKPLGQFIVLEGNKYVGIDNEDGYAWTEDFDTEVECIRWLLTGEHD